MHSFSSRFLSRVGFVVRTFCTASLALSVIANAQSLPAPTADDSMGSQAYQSYHGGDIDAVGLTTGTLTINVPILSYPQRGKLHLSFNLMYNNQPQHYTWYCLPTGSCFYVWSLNVPNSVLPLEKGDAFVGWGQQFALSSTSFSVKYPQSVEWYSNFSLQFPDGSKHTLANTGAITLGGSPPTQQWVYHGPLRTLDATGWQVQGPLAAYPGQYNNWMATSGVVDPDGVTYGSTEQDPNGNLITTSPTTITDSLGRQIPFPPNVNSTAKVAKTGCPSSVGGISPTYAVLWNVPGYNDSAATYKFCYGNVTINIPSTTNIHGGSGPVAETKLLSIVLPNGQSWQFEYKDSDGTIYKGAPTNFGTLSQITLPTGGTISYTYASGSNNCLNSGGRWVATRALNPKNGGPIESWTYSYGINANSTVVTDSLGNDIVHTFGFGTSCTGYETQTLYYTSSYKTGAVVKTVNTTYSGSSSSGNVYPYGMATVVPTSITTIWAVDNQTTEITRSYDSGYSFTDWFPNGTDSGIYGKVIAETNYDYGGSGAPGSVLRTTTNNYMALGGPNASSYLDNNLLNLFYTVQVEDGSSNQLSLTQYNYDENDPVSSGLSGSNQFDATPPTGKYRGDNTSVYRWLNSGTFTCANGASGGSKGNLISTKTYFDDGMLNTSADPCGNGTTYTYSSTDWGAFPTVITNALKQVTTNAYDFNTGLLTSTTGPNKLVTSYGYDSLWRLTQVDYPDGGQDTISRQEKTFPFSAQLTRKINSTQSMVRTNVFDGLGRITQTKLTSDPQGTVYTDTSYDGLGRIATVSNPYRTGTDATTSTGTTTYAYDAVSRKISVTYPDKSVLGTAYCGPNTLVTDPTGKWRRSRVDGIGRLVEVDEPNAVGATVNANGCPAASGAPPDPIWVTSYTVDAPGNLTQVVQNGSHKRTFTYDSLSRLLCSSNPENSSAACPAFGGTLPTSGAVVYAYNPDGTLFSRTDARSITTSYTWDPLYRETGVSYSNGDSPISYAYDQSGCLGLGKTCQNIGRRTSMTDGTGSEAWAYDVDKTKLQSIHQEQRTNNSSPKNITKTSTYYFDLSGDVTQLVYPTGRTVNYTYDSAGRPSKAEDSANGITYVADWKTPPAGTKCTASDVCYTPQGTVYGMSLGQTSSFKGLDVSESFNNRLQPNEIKASTSSYGTVLDLTYSFVDPTTQGNAGHAVTVTNNLDATRTVGFAYDQLNRLTEAGGGSGPHCWGYLYNYDAWGNLLAQAGWMPYYSNCTETKMGQVTADNCNHISAFSYDVAGNTQNEYVFFGGKRVVQVPSSGGALYYVEDMLGTSRVIATASGMCYDADFVPFGGERAYTATCSQNYRFEGKERDAETQNDNFGAREYSWRFGRWLSSDWSGTLEPVPYANLSNPQTLNLYAMVEDDPESFADLDGHIDAANGSTDSSVQKGCAFAATCATATSQVVPPPPIIVAPTQAEIDQTVESILQVSASAAERIGVTVADVFGAALLTVTYLASPDKAGGGKELQFENEVKEGGQGAELAPAAGGAGALNGRGGKQSRLRELANDDKVSSAARGEIKRDMNEISQGKRSNIRVPQGMQLAHRRGQEARKGYSYKHSDLQGQDLHRLQHKIEGYN